MWPVNRVIDFVVEPTNTCQGVFIPWWFQQYREQQGLVYVTLLQLPQWTWLLPWTQNSISSNQKCVWMHLMSEPLPLAAQHKLKLNIKCGSHRSMWTCTRLSDLLTKMLKDKTKRAEAMCCCLCMQWQGHVVPDTCMGRALISTFIKSQRFLNIMSSSYVVL